MSKDKEMTIGEAREIVSPYVPGRFGQVLQDILYGRDMVNIVKAAKLIGAHEERERQKTSIGKHMEEGGKLMGIEHRQDSKEYYSLTS